MDWLTFFSNIIPSLAWPIATVILVVIFKKPICNIIPNLQQLRHLKVKDMVEIEFEKNIVETKLLANEAKLPDSKEILKPDSKSTSNDMPSEIDRRIEYLFRLSEDNPRAAIIESWLMLEECLRDIAAKYQLSFDKFSVTMKFINVLAQHELINSDIKSIIEHLRLLRNKSVHDYNFDLKSAQAKEYVELTLRVMAALQQG